MPLSCCFPGNQLSPRVATHAKARPLQRLYRLTPAKLLDAEAINSPGHLLLQQVSLQKDLNY